MSSRNARIVESALSPHMVSCIEEKVVPMRERQVSRRPYTLMNTKARDGMPIQIEDDLWLLDTLHQGEPRVIASYLITGKAGLGLVDVGPTATVSQLLASIKAAGYDPLAIEHLVLTHIHLDHAGAAGVLANILPHARVYVHRMGARHLLDPAKLLASAQRIYGAEMETLWGTIEPVPEERLVVVEEGSELRVGERTLRALYTPGHAVHHVAYFDPERNTVFAGDVAGVRLDRGNTVRPPTPPPDLSLEDWSASIDRLLDMDLMALYLAHFGKFADVVEHLSLLRERLDVWGQLILVGMRKGESTEQLAGRLAADTQREVDEMADDNRAQMLRQYELASNNMMSALGYVRYFTKYHPELLAIEGNGAE